MPGHIPFRGEGEPQLPPGFKKGRHTLTKEQIRRGNLFLIIILLGLLGITAIASKYLPQDTRTEFWEFLALGIVILLLMAGLDKGITAWNKYLKGDDLDEKVDEVNSKDYVKTQEE